MTDPAPPHGARSDPETRRALHALRGADFAAQVSLAADATWALRFALDSAAVQTLLARCGPELDTLVLDRLAALAAVQVDPEWANPHEAELVGLLALATHGLTPASVSRAVELARAVPNAVWCHRLTATLETTRVASSAGSTGCHELPSRET